MNLVVVTAFLVSKLDTMAIRQFLIEYLYLNVVCGKFCLNLYAVEYLMSMKLLVCGITSVKG